MMLWESKYALKVKPGGIKIFALKNHGLQALWFLEWQGSESSIFYTISNYTGWPGEIGLRKFLQRSYSATPMQVKLALGNE